MKTFLSFITACLITTAAFAATSGSPVFQIRLVREAPSGDTEPMTIVSKEKKEVLNVQKTVLLDESAVKSAGVRTDASGHPQIGITFRDEGGKRFEEITREKVGQRLAIIIDGRLYCAPIIRTEIAGGKAEISGNFSKAEANTLAAKIIDAIKKH